MDCDCRVAAARVKFASVAGSGTGRSVLKFGGPLRHAYELFRRGDGGVPGPHGCCVETPPTRLLADSPEHPLAPAMPALNADKMSKYSC